MTKPLSAFDVWDKVTAVIDPETREALLIELCEGDEVLLSDTRGLVEVYESVGTIDDAFSTGLIDVHEGSFEPRTLCDLKANSFKLHEYYDEGAIGYVFRAIRGDSYLIEQRAAIKVIKPHLSHLYSYDLIHREAEIMASLSHKYIVKVFDAGIVEFGHFKLPFYVMDFVEGKNIVEHFRGSHVSISEVIECFIKLLEALDFAHSADYSVVHGDFKPENILIDRFGDPKLLDFGVAQRVRDKQSDMALIGSKYAKHYSLAYSSPELLASKPLSGSSDIYSLGKVLHEVITGCEPDEDVDINEECYALSKNVSSSLALGKYKRWMPELDAIVAKATNNDEDERFYAHEMLGELRRWLVLDKVDTFKSNKEYDFMKFAMINPKSAYIGFAGAISLFCCCVALVLFLSWWPQESIDARFNAQLSAKKYEDNLLAYSGSSLDADKNVHALLEADFILAEKNDRVSDAVRFDLLKKIALVAADRRYDKLALDALEAAHEINVDDVLVAALYAKALYVNGDGSEAEALVEALSPALVAGGLDSVEMAEVVLELLDAQTRYIVDYFGESTTTLSLLVDIERDFYTLLPDKYQAKLQRLKAEELFYVGTGDGVSASAGELPEVYSEVIRPKMNEALGFFHFANIHDDEEALNYSLYARILYELQQYDKAEKYAEIASEQATMRWGKYSPVTERIFRSNYALYRFLNLDKAEMYAKLAEGVHFNIANTFGAFNYGSAQLNLSLVVYALLYKGRFDEVLVPMRRLAANVKNKQYGDFVGLDSFYSAAINYLEFTSFDISRLDDDFFRKRWSTVVSHLVTDYADRMSDYELVMIDLYNAYFKNDKKQALALISKVSTLRLASSKNEADMSDRLLLNTAIIAAKFGADEYAVELANAVEPLMMLSELEVTHSTANMVAYLQLGDIYKQYAMMDRYYEVMAKAEIVYKTHYETLKDSSFSSYFEPVEFTL